MRTCCACACAMSMDIPPSSLQKSNHELWWRRLLHLPLLLRGLITDGLQAGSKVDGGLSIGEDKDSLLIGNAVPVPLVLGMSNMSNKHVEQAGTRYSC